MSYSYISDFNILKLVTCRSSRIYDGVSSVYAGLDRQVSAWLALREDELYEAWNNTVQMKQLSKIKPLD